MKRSKPFTNTDTPNESILQLNGEENKSLHRKFKERKKPLHEESPMVKTIRHNSTR